MRDLRANILIIDGPEPVESKHVLVVVADVFHLIPILVSDTVVNSFELDLWQELR